MKELHICETVERSTLWVSRCPSSLCTAAYLHPLHLFGAEEGDVSLCPLYQQHQEARQHHTTAHAHSAPTWKTHRHVCMHVLYAHSTAKGSQTHTHTARLRFPHKPGWVALRLQQGRKIGQRWVYMHEPSVKGGEGNRKSDLRERTPVERGWEKRQRREFTKFRPGWRYERVDFTTARPVCAERIRRLEREKFSRRILREIRQRSSRGRDTLLTCWFGPASGNVL